MPIKNSEDKSWTAWLVDGLGAKEEEFYKALWATLNAREFPSASFKSGTTNMWWRRDSHFIDVKSDMDGKIECTIHLQEYATGLFVGRAAESYSQTNYYKRMAAAAFLETVDRCIYATILTMVGESEVHELVDSRKQMVSN